MNKKCPTQNEVRSDVRNRQKMLDIFLDITVIYSNVCPELSRGTK